MAGYSDLKSKLESEFNVTVDFDTIRKDKQKIMLLDQMLLGAKPTKNPNDTLYKEGLLTFVHHHIDSVIKMNHDVDYNYLSGFDLVRFLTMYEAMMDAKHKEGPNKDTPREPYDGMSETIFEDLKKSVEIYDKPLSEIWADKLVSGHLSYKEIKTIMNDEIDYVNNSVKENGGDPDNIPEQTIASLANIEMAQKALDKAWKDRDLLWRFTHPIEAIQQYYYKSKLGKTVNTLREMKITTDEYMKENDDLSESMMKHVYENSEYTAQKLKIEAKSAKTQQNEKTETRIPLPNINLDSVIKRDEFEKKFSSELNAVRLHNPLSEQLEKDINTQESELKSAPHTESPKIEVPNLGGNQKV